MQHALYKLRIVDVFDWVDDTMPKTRSTGRRPVLSDSEVAATLLWDGLTEPFKTLRDVYSWIRREYE